MELPVIFVIVAFIVVVDTLLTADLSLVAFIQVHDLAADFTFPFRHHSLLYNK